jgi:hypothetical protein
MPVPIVREFDRGTLAHLNLLNKVEAQMLPPFDRARMAEVRAELEALRPDAPAAEIYERYPNVNVDRGLLKSAGTEPEAPAGVLRELLNF